MEPQVKQQIAERLKTANNVLVTVSANPSVDQLAAAIGFTLLLNKLGKHGTAVFSGEVPSTLEFLQPEQTIEKNTDSLRDFIISLDKSKADKLRYKVEDKVVKIFITPYRTSLSDKDLEFSQGDFNVDAVVALGVKTQKDLDEAIVAHGRILHDATVISINLQDKSTLGNINWNESDASSLCELLVSLGESLGPGLFDAQMATAFLTGIVAETSRFSNDKTSPRTMTIAAHLMSVGANQQLIASKLEKPAPPPEEPKPEDKPAEEAEEKTPAEPADKPAEVPAELPKPATEMAKEEPKTSANDGSLKIDHGLTVPPLDLATLEASSEEEEEAQDQIDIDQEGTLHRLDLEDKNTDSAPADDKDGSRLITEPPTMNGQLTANTEPEKLEPSVDPLSMAAEAAPLLDHEEPAAAITPTPGPDQPPTPHEARAAVDEAIQAAPVGSQPLPPIEALNAHPIDLSSPATGNQTGATTEAQPTPEIGQAKPSVDSFSAQNGIAETTGPATPPPPVPPPMMPPTYLQSPPPANDDENNPQDPLAAI